jgi:hypothetical protein
MLDGKRDSAGESDQRNGDFGRSGPFPGAGNKGSSFDKELDDEIPF